MRFFEFADSNDGLEKLTIVLKNFIGRAASKKAPVKLNWNALNQISQNSGAEVAADYETFKSMYDNSPALQTLVKNFNADGIELNVPGVADENEPQPDGTQSPKDSQAAVDKIAASAAPQQLASQA